MINFTELRTYFATQIAAVDPNLQENTQDPFNVEDVASYEGDKFYKLVFGPTTLTNTAGNAYGYDVQINLVLYSLSDRDEVTSYDTLYTKAVNIRECIQHPEDAKQDGITFSDILGVSITPGVEESDDKLFSMDLEFILRSDYYYN